MGEGLSWGESRDATFVLTGVSTWVGKLVYLAMDPLTIQEGWWEIARAITKWQIMARDPGHPCVNPLTPQPFRFDHLGDSAQKDTPRDANSDHQLSPHQPPRGQNCNGHRRDQGQPTPQPPLPSPNHGAHMKINLSDFKDEDAKDAVTYLSWRWDLTKYHYAGCRDHTLLLYAIQSLQGYPGELVQSSGMDITLDDMLMILDDHYNNVKVLDALKQELFQICMTDKETILDWGVCLLRHLQL